MVEVVRKENVEMTSRTINDENHIYMGVVSFQEGTMLSDDNQDIIIIDIDTDGYIKRRGVDYDDYRKMPDFDIGKDVMGTNAHVTIAHPIVSITNRTNCDLAVNAMNQTYTVSAKPEKGLVYGKYNHKRSDITLLICQPALEGSPLYRNEITLQLPAVNLKNKDIFIRTFDMWISLKNPKNLQRIIDSYNKSIILGERSNDVADKPIGITITGPVSQGELMYYSINGIVSRLKTTWSGNDTYDITLSSDNLVDDLVGSIDVSGVSKSGFGCIDIGGYEVIIGYSRQVVLDQLDSRYQLRNLIKDKGEGAIAETINELKNKIDEKEDIISKKDDQIADRDRKLKHKEDRIVELLMGQRIEQEKLKTTQQEVKLKETIVSSDSSTISDTLKVGGAVLSTAAILATVFIKLKSGGFTSRMVEWAYDVCLPALATATVSHNFIGGAGIGINFAEIASTLTGAIDTIKNIGRTAIDKIGSACGWVKDKVSSAVSWCGEKISSAVSWLTSWF